MIHAHNLLILVLSLWLLLTQKPVNGAISTIERLRKPKDGDLRLVDGIDKASGTVQIYRGYSWGIICDDHWTMKEGNVVCRQLGVGYAVKIYRNNFFKSSNTKDYLLDDVHCIGNETNLLDCKNRGWGVHNCKKNEQVGIQCLLEFKPRSKPVWNPLNLDLTKEEISTLDKTKFTLVKAVEPIKKEKSLLYPVMVQLPGSSIGPVCPDFFSSSEAMVYCKSLNLGISGRALRIEMDPKLFPAQRHLAIVGRCYGNETSLTDCTHYSASMKQESEQLPCKVDTAVAVECSPDGYVWKSRILIRFSSIIDNIGTGQFIPFEDMKNWEWHACHMHYHSMKTFALYNLIDPKNRVIATGHKASFCLEDSECNRGVEKKFQCSNVAYNFGTQGISPGCRDTYMHDYDCQWIDVTGVKPGIYNLEVMYNPEMLVPESDFFNNGLACKVHLSSVSADVRNCKLLHPLDMT